MLKRSTKVGMSAEGRCLLSQVGGENPHSLERVAEIVGRMWTSC